VTVLFLTHRLPYAPNRGDRIRAFFLLKFLRQWADVTVMSLVHDADEEAQADNMRRDGWDVVSARVPRPTNALRSGFALPSSRPTTHTMLDTPALRAAIRRVVANREPDIVIAYCSGMAQYALEEPLRRYPMILDMVDVDSAKWRQLSTVTAPPLSWIYRREARTLASFEQTAAMAAVATTVVTANESASLKAIAPEARVEVVPNGVDVESFRNEAPPEASADVVFCGVMNYAPNENAAHLLAREVWPSVRRARPDATLTIVGSQPTAAVLRLADPALGITVTGAVPDVRPYLWRAAVAAAPLVTARGIQNKVLEAVAAGLPTVVTPNIVESLPRQLLPAVVGASGSTDLAAAVVSLLAQSAAERRAMAARADVTSLGWDRQLAPFGDLLRDALASPRLREGSK
jgi:sugar transferase (PEP-CTERM/EpsH1 system associated)